jgi:pimeloyl-ACP methyl ester carboxylesterase
LEEGRLVDVGGYSLFIKCTGKGSPTVVMDADLGRSASELDYVRPEVAKVTRACAYTRARLGADDPGPQPRTSGKIVDDLHKLLANAHIAGPYVLVGNGNGFGGFNVRLYAGRYPGEVAGMVLVDAWHEDQLKLVLCQSRFDRQTVRHCPWEHGISATLVKETADASQVYRDPDARRTDDA